MKTIISVVGARPQFIKLAPLASALDERNDIKHVIVHTGQHYDTEMSDVFFESMGIRVPDYQYVIKGTSHAVQTADMMVKLEETFLEEKPAAIIIFGDTNSTLAAAIVGSKLHIPLIHVEAGLRSFDRTMPEEVNRIMTDHVSSYLSCVSKLSYENLAKEGLADRASIDGDIMYDALLHFLPQAKERVEWVRSLGVSVDEYYVLTMHRNFNVDNETRLRCILDALLSTSKDIVFPIHPRTRKQLHAFHLWKRLENAPHIHIVDPVGYIDMMALLYFSQAVLTDSGGLQKEAYLMKKPCITIRPNTEWVETVASGWNTLVCDPDTGILNQAAFSAALAALGTATEETWEPYYGKGKTVANIIQAIEQYV